MPTSADYLSQLTSEKNALANNLVAKGVEASTSETFTTLVPKVLNIPTGGGVVEPVEKDVNFYDFDGTRLYSYTKAEFMALNEMPELKAQEGFTAQNWNWTLQEAKNYLNKSDDLDIGQVCVTSDGKTRIYIEVDNYTRFIYLNLRVKGSFSIDWGDGSTIEQYSDTSGNYIDYARPHTYSSNGRYVIAIGVETGSALWFYPYVQQYCAIISGDENGTNLRTNGAKNIFYRNMIEKVELGSSVNLSNYCFANTYIESVNLPENYGSTTLGLFLKTPNLKFIVFPRSRVASSQFGENMFATSGIEQVIFAGNVTLDKIPNNFFNLDLMYNIDFSEVMNLKKINIPLSVTTIGQRVFYQSGRIKRIKFFGNITSIDLNAFNFNKSLEEIDFRYCTAVPTLGNSNIFTSNCKIYVPASLETEWKTATNWSNYASQIIGV